MVAPSISQKNRRRRRLPLVNLCRWSIAGVLVVGTTTLLTTTTTTSSSLDYDYLTNPLQPVSSVKDMESIVKNCTSEQRLMIRRQLPKSKHCEVYGNDMDCSIVMATKCPQPTWLEDYYTYDLQQATTDFLALNVGCNKGLDAVNLLRMGTRNPLVERTIWKQALKKIQPKARRLAGVCSQGTAVDFPLSATMTQSSGQVHCIEPMPFNTRPLLQALQETHYDKHGLVIVPMGMSNQVGELWMETGTVVANSTNRKGKRFGFEAMGIQEAQERCRQHADFDCERVPISTLDAYYTSLKGRRIHVLTIDTEGNDFNVLKGAQQHVLARTEYLEFEHHFELPWRMQSLPQAIDLLDAFDFTCYWAGMGYLWRITHCWVYEDLQRKWSNVACANRKLAPELARRMERVFQQTLEKTELVYA